MTPRVVFALVVALTLTASGCGGSFEGDDAADHQRHQLDAPVSGREDTAVVGALGATPRGMAFVGENRVDDPIDAAALRLTLQALLTRHSEAVTVQSREILDGASTAGSDALLASTVFDLRASIDQLHGEEAARAFEQLWAGHLEVVSGYASALRSEDRDTMVGQVERSRAFEADFAGYLHTLTDGNAARQDVHAALRSHLAAVFEHADAWALGAHQLAFVRAADAQHHLDTVAAMLANGMALSQSTTVIGTVFDDLSADCAAHQLAQLLTVASRFDLARAASSVDEREAAHRVYESRLESASADTLHLLDEHRRSIEGADPGELVELHATLRRILLAEVRDRPPCDR